MKTHIQSFTKFEESKRGSADPNIKIKARIRGSLLEIKARIRGSQCQNQSADPRIPIKNLKTIRGSADPQCQNQSADPRIPKISTWMSPTYFIPGYIKKCSNITFFVPVLALFNRLLKLNTFEYTYLFSFSFVLQETIQIKHSDVN